MNADVALLQEVKRFPSKLPEEVSVDPYPLYEPWNKQSFDRWPAIVKLTNRVQVEWFKRVFPISELGIDEFGVSGIGLATAAKISCVDENVKPFIALSMYARWIRPHKTTNSKWKVGYVDGSAHRILSDLSTFIGHQDPSTHRILAAGDLNICFDGLDDNPNDLPERTRSVFERFNVLGLELVGPRYPHGQKADPTPKGFPTDTKNVPTFALFKKPRNAQLQLDYVFASRSFHNEVHSRALNEPEQWGPSDHCRILITVSKYD